MNRLEAEHAFRAAEDRYRALLSTLLEGVVVVEDGIIVFANPSMEHITGYSAEEIVLRPLGTFTDAVGLTYLEEASERLIDESLKFELPLRRKDGTTRRVSVVASPFPPREGVHRATIALIVDVTELTDLRESEERFAKAFRSSPAAIAITRKSDGRYLEVNDAALRLLRYSREELVGRTTAELDLWVHPEDRQHVIEVLKTKGRVQNAEYRLRRKDGDIADTDYSAEVVEIGGEECILALVIDTTETKRDKEELRRAHDELERRVIERTKQLADANDELEAFSYSVSHDLRAPLRAMDGFSHILLEDYAEHLDADMRDLLERVRAAAVRMGDLIEGMQRMARLARTELHVGQVDLGEMAATVISELREAAPDRHVSFRAEPNLGVQADPDLLRSVMHNLLSNAWKYTSTREHAVIELGRTRHRDKPCFFVRDNGVGFDNAYAADLFIPFQRLHNDPRFAGTGIGLSTVQRILRRHGGQIWAEGETDKGAAFYFTLP
jgi:hypothetical protein